MDPNLKRAIFYITAGQDAFLKRKIAELKQKAPPEDVDKITESTAIQGLLNLWMAVEKSNET